MARTSNKARKPQSPKGNVAPGILFLVACAFAAFIALSSPIMATFYIGFSLLCVLLYSESRARVINQQATGFRIKNLEENNRFFTGENTRTRHDISNLQTRLRDIELEKKPVAQNNGAAAQPKQMTSGPLRTPNRKGPVQDNFSNKFLTMLKRSTMPRATKPTAAPVKDKKPVANDRKEDDLGLSDLVVEELVQHAVAQENINTFLQPIMRLPNRRIEYYEMFARIRARPGVYMPASRYLDIAHQNNLVSDIDTILLEESIRMIRGSAHMDKTTPFFMNIAGGSLKNKNFMNTLLLFLARDRALAGQLILEMPQNEFMALPMPIRKIVKSLGLLGCGFSIDNVRDLNIDEEQLSAMGIKFIKIRTQTFLNRAEKDTEFAQLRHLKNRLEKVGVKVIAERIENEKSMLELADYDISYGQGHALARPDLQSAFETQQKERA